jgi:hypothetical protein
VPQWRILTAARSRSLDLRTATHTPDSEIQLELLSPTYLKMHSSRVVEMAYVSKELVVISLLLLFLFVFQSPQIVNRSPHSYHLVVISSSSSVTNYYTAQLVVVLILNNYSKQDSRSSHKALASYLHKQLLKTR